jgi:hypothetical protein
MGSSSFLICKIFLEKKWQPFRIAKRIAKPHEREVGVASCLG